MHYINQPLRGAAIVLLTVALPLSFLFACGGDKKDMVDISFNAQSSYTLKETNVETFVSDSGITRYKVITQTWLIFGKANEPFWYFPDGIYLDKFDTVFNTEASIKADTAYYYERRKLWKLDGNVDVSNFKGERFQTQQLFWDQNKESVYSDSFITITKGENVKTGQGFRSTQDMNDYQIFHSTGEYTINTESKTQTDSLTNNRDTIPQAGEQVTLVF